METREVYWLGKFDGRKVTINAVDFDPAIHSAEPWPEPKAEKGDGKKDEAKKEAK